ncbi:MAG: thermonuclease family protein [Geminicoccaceae bacterium]|nr:thermonuclease family protein [Geminicoccaceae bacterium]
MRLTSAAFAVAWLIATCLPALAEEIRGRVVAITDGDTLTVLDHAHTQIKIRLAEIDTPEKGQPYGSQAKLLLSDLAFGHEVTVDVQDTDRYGRSVGRVHAASVDVNAEMVRAGAAWAYRQYLHDVSLLALEAEARDARRGLWALPKAQRTPPWDWRRAKRTPAITVARSTGSACGAKRYCKQMASCDEATFYLKQCGLTRLDGDGDGVPCESLCRVLTQ